MNKIELCQLRPVSHLHMELNDGQASHSSWNSKFVFK